MLIDRKCTRERGEAREERERGEGEGVERGERDEGRRGVRGGGVRILET